MEKVLHLKKTSFSKNLDVENIFYTELENIYGTEKKLIEKFPKSEENNITQKLQRAFADYVSIKKQHIIKLRKMLDAIGIHQASSLH